MTRISSTRLVGTLGAVVLTVAILQTSVVPILGAIAGQLQVSRGAVGWVVTANLLAAAAAAPLVGRLADLYNKKTVLLGTLAVVLVGSLLGAVTSSLPLLVLGRALQGTSFAVYPIAVSILRDELPADRLFRAIGSVSATLGLGSALALLSTGFLMPEGASYHRVFWLLTGLVIGAMVLSAAMVPSRPRIVTEKVDWFGAMALALGLSLLMLTITKGSVWGWGSFPTLAITAASIGVMVVWWRWTRRCPYPLVSTALLGHRPVLRANISSFLVGTGSYFSLLGLSTCAGSPIITGHGFGANAQGISLQFLLPGAVAATATAMITGRLIERFGARTVMLGGGVIGVVGFVMLAIGHGSRGQLFTAGLLTSAYISLAYGALTALIVGYVEPGETGIANSLNGIFSKVGGATAAAMIAPLLTSVGGSSAQSGYLILFSTGAVTTALAVLLVWRGRPSPVITSDTPEHAGSPALVTRMR